MTLTQERWCQAGTALSALLAAGLLVLDFEQFRYAGAGLMFVCLALAMLPDVFPVPPAGSPEEHRQRLQRRMKRYLKGRDGPFNR